MSLIRSASTVSLFTLLSRITGLARELLIAASFGASALTDAFNVAFRIPNLLRRLFAEGAFSQAFVPVLASTKAEQGDAATKALVDKTASLLAWALLLVSVMGVLGAPLLVWLLASGLSTSGEIAAVAMTRIMFPYIAFMSLVALASGVLNTYKHFAVPAFTPVLLNIAMIGAALLAGSSTGSVWLQSMGVAPIYALAAGVILGGALQLGMQWLALKRLGLRPTLAWRWSGIRAAWQDSGTRRILTLMLPALFGVGVAQLSLIINTQIASHMAVGSVSWLSFADRLMEFPTAMLGVALGVVLMPALSSAKARMAHEPEHYSNLLDWGLRLVVVFALPAAVALFVFAKPLVASLYHYGAFTERDVMQTAQALSFYGLGLLGLVAIKVLASGYFAQQNTKTPVKAALVALIATQLLNLATVPHFAHAGLALSIGLGALLNALLLLVGLCGSKRYRPLAGWSTLCVKVLLACAVLALGLWWCSHALPWTQWRSEPLLRLATLLAIVAVAALLYLGLLQLLGIKLRGLLRAPVANQTQSK